MEIETVRIVSNKTAENPFGYIVINKEDLKDGDKLFSETPEVKEVTENTHKVK